MCVLCFLLCIICYMSKKNVIFLFTIIVAILLAIGFYLYKENIKISEPKEEFSNKTKIEPKTDEQVLEELKSAPYVKPKSDIQTLKELKGAQKKDIPVKTDEEILNELKQFQ